MGQIDQIGTVSTVRGLCAAFHRGAGAAALMLLAATSAWAGSRVEPGEFLMLPGWNEDRLAEVIPLFAASCPRLEPAFQPACAEVRRVPRGDEAAARAFLEWAFRPAFVGEARFTGYFELDVAGSLTRGGPYQWPLLRAPANPTSYSRQQILGGALAGRGLELVWLSSAADLYFVQLQGSARVHLPDGRMLRVGGQVQNGWGSIAVSDLFGGASVPNHDMSIPALRAWSATHPQDAEALIAKEGAYFYFDRRPNSVDEGPLGALGVPLTPLRSVAVDPKHVPLGSLVWIGTEVSASRQKLQRMMLAQDTGEPIRGPAHVDLYFGAGPNAEAVGGREYASGGLWVLVPR